jgi:hypothetical protein
MMLKLWKLPTTCRQLAEDARIVAGRRDVLYHGTRHPRSVLRMNRLFYSYPGISSDNPFLSGGRDLMRDPVTSRANGGLAPIIERKLISPSTH